MCAELLPLNSSKFQLFAIPTTVLKQS